MAAAFARIAKAEEEEEEEEEEWWRYTRLRAAPMVADKEGSKGGGPEAVAASITATKHSSAGV